MKRGGGGGQGSMKWTENNSWPAFGASVPVSVINWAAPEEDEGDWIACL